MGGRGRSGGGLGRAFRKMEWPTGIPFFETTPQTNSRGKTAGGNVPANYKLKTQLEQVFTCLSLWSGD